MTGLEKKREKKCLRNNLPENTKKVENEKQFESFARMEIKRSELKFPECLEVERAWARAHEPKVKHLTKLTEAPFIHARN